MSSNNYRTSFYLDKKVNQIIVSICDENDIKLGAFFRKAIKYALETPYNQIKPYGNYQSDEMIKKIISIPQDLFNEVKCFCEYPDINVKRSEFYRMAVYYFLVSIKTGKINI